MLLEVSLCEIGDIYISADGLQGQARYDFLEQSLAELNRND